MYSIDPMGLTIHAVPDPNISKSYKDKFTKKQTKRILAVPYRFSTVA
jgi:hypothetical protein